MKRLAFFVAVLALGAGPAAALDQAYDWSGAYIGAQAGYGWGSGGMTVPVAPYLYYTDTRPNGISGGLYAGYNHQFSNGLIIGVDTDFTWHNATDMSYRQRADLPPIVSGNNIDTQNINWTAALRARAGYAINRWMPYLSIGKEWANVDQTIINGGTYHHLGKTTFSGWTVGVGVEYALNENITLRSDYRFSDFDDKSITPIGFGITPDWHLKTHDLRFGIAYKF